MYLLRTTKHHELQSICVFIVQDVFKCNAATCGKFYHIECLKADPYSIIVPPKIHALTKEVKVAVPSLAPSKA